MFINYLGNIDRSPESLGSLQHPYIPKPIWGFPKIGGTFFGVPIIRTIVYWDHYHIPKP